MATTSHQQLHQFVRLRHRPQQLWDLQGWFAQENPLERLGRFWWVRGLYSRWQALRQWKQPIPKQYRTSANSILFSGLDANFSNRAIAQLRTNAIAPGLTLPPSTTAAILRYATSFRCFEPGRQRPFYIDEVQGESLDGKPVFRGLVDSPEDCPEIQQLLNTPLLLNIVRRYLRYWPTKITTHLTWSFPTTLPLNVVQQAYPPTRYHYDIAGFNFMTVYFYITAVAKVSDGAHVMIPSTHKHKPLCLMRSGSHSEQTIDHYFGLDKAMPILGPAGFGFMQDPSCIHRLHPPANKHRLLLQFRYS